MIRAEAISAFDIIRSTALVNAELLNRAGELAVAGDPLTDISLVDGQSEHVTHIIKGGVFYKRQ